MANTPKGPSPRDGHRRATPTRRAEASAHRQVPQARCASHASRGVHSPRPYAPSPYSSATHSRSAARRRPQQQRRSKTPLIAAIVSLLAIAVIAYFFVVPAVKSMFAPQQGQTVAAGQDVSITIPEGASGDDIASILSKNHVIENPKDYYAAVAKEGAEMSLKPGDYALKTGMDAVDVVRQLVAGPNSGAVLTIQEGLTLEQTAERVEAAYGISKDEFLAQAKASKYADDYPFLEGAYNDSLEGYLYPKTYTFTGAPSADDIIRKLLDQFVSETASLNLDKGANGLSAQQIVTMASLIERETAVDSERPTIASVIYNRLDADMPLQIDAAIVYARGGGNQAVTYSDLEIDSPYNVYKNYGLTPGPICSPSISSIKAALNPDKTDYLYYVASATGDGTHKFSSDYEQFEKDSQEYSESLSS
ncbi:endolytic transglycosylase MltG [Collinsella bouchesdurhonensis]|uniref:endolytic transglycosylase MltG n=1 Tax=Collinsella bouchesdurhonensis TaxID=1907654 RepID=UPI003F8B0013